MNNTSFGSMNNQQYFINSSVDEIFSPIVASNLEINAQEEILVELLEINNHCFECPKVEKRMYNKTTKGLFNTNIVPEQSKYNCRNCEYKK